MSALRVRLAVPGALLILLAGAPVPTYAAPAAPLAAQATALPPNTLETERVDRPVAPGVTLSSFDRIDQGGWLRGDALTADLTGGSTVDYLYSGAVSTPEPLAGPANRAKAVAAINGDFFDINNSGAAQGIGIQSGALIQSPVQGHNNAVGLGADGVGRVLQVFFEGTATPAGATPITLTQFNNLVAAGGVGVFTSAWGSYPRTRAAQGSTLVTEVTIVDGVITQVAPAAGEGPIPAGTTVLLGRDAGAAALAGLSVGTAIAVQHRPRADGDVALRAAIGGNYVLVRDGVAQQIADASLAPRTAVGFSADGKTMYLLTVDGRQADSRGVTLTEMGVMMRDLGARQALNLDGGGSSTLLAREPGAASVQIENQPSDGGLRPVPNGLAIYAPAGSGTLKGYWVETAIDPRTAPGLDPVAGGRPNQVFPGLTRKLTAAGYDETYGPAAGNPLWRATPAHHGFVAGDGVFRALLPGKTKVTAANGAAAGSTDLTVLGPLRTITPTAQRVAVKDLTTTATFGVVGADAEGRTAPIEPSDVSLDYDRSLFSVTPRADGSFQVQGLREQSAGLLTIRVGAATASLPVLVGLVDQPVADFENASAWTFSTARATGSAAPAPGRVGTGLAMSYDYSTSTATRAAYANPPSYIDVPGEPLAFTMWINSAGKGEWPSLNLVDGRGQELVLRGPYLTWTGWQQVEFTVPPGTAYPVKVRRFYTAETRATTQYTSQIVIDELMAKVPPAVAVPPVTVRPDPLVVTDGTVAGAPWRFAVLSDAQFVGREPDSEIVRNARRALREIKAAGPDFLLINGDLVDEGRPEDLALAKRILDEELAGALPYYYVPGNHEVMGGDIGNFKAAFGDTFRVFDHAGTRFVTLDTSRLTVRGGGVEQFALLRQALDQAATADGIGSVVLVEHVPPRDPSVAKASQLSDRKEAALIERWLSEFTESTGKGALFIGGHVGQFHAAHVGGVPYFINGNSGKTPSAAPADGGFWGWTMFGVDPVSPGEAASARQDPLNSTVRWVSAQTMARVDGLELTAPPTVALGTSAGVTATVAQGGRLIPVASPVSADWSGSAAVHVGSIFGLRPWHLAWFDPAIGRLYPLRPGTVTLSVTVNGVTTSTDIAITTP